MNADPRVMEFMPATLSRPELEVTVAWLSVLDRPSRGTTPKRHSFGAAHDQFRCRILSLASNHHHKSEDV